MGAARNENYEGNLPGFMKSISHSTGSWISLPTLTVPKGGAFLWRINPQANLITAFVFGIIGTVKLAVLGRDIPAPIKGLKFNGLKKWK